MINIQQRFQWAWVKYGLCLVLLILMGGVSAWAASPPTVYVDWDGGGDYNTDGTNDEVQINQALTFVGNNLGSGYTTVYLRGAHDYIIDASVKIPSGVTLTGDSTAAIKLVNSAGWSASVPMITATGTSGMHDITVHGFEVDGNDANQPGINRGQNYYDMLLFRGTTRLYVYDMYLHDNTNDGLQVRSCSYVYYHDNDIIRHGHDGLQTYASSYIYAYNNTITNRTNCGIRFADSNHCEAYGNNISTASGGNCGIQVQRSNSGTVMDDIKVHDNILHTSAGPGIWQFCNQSTTYSQDKARYVKIYNNVFYSCNGGIQSTGWYDTYVDNNVFDACGNAIYIYANPSFPPPSGGTGYDLHMNNNILCYNTYGIRQTYTNGSHTVDSDYDDFYSNTTNNSGSGITITHQLTVDPKFADRASHNYYLKSTAGRWNGSTWVVDAESSPLIDAGDPTMSYSNEPEDNGDRINVGAYGNTIHASKSGEGGGGELPTSMDNRIKDNAPDTNYPTNTFLDVGYNGAKYRDIIWFDLDPYMDDGASAITNAKLSMYWYYPSSTRTADTVVQIMKPESGWDHSYVTWNSKANGTAWSYAGGDWTDANDSSQGSTAFASVTFPAGTVATNQYYDWNVTHLVQDIITAGVNPGMFIKASAETSANYIAFYGNGNASNRPKLSITKIASQTEGTAAYDNRMRSGSPTTVYLTTTYNDVGNLVGSSSFRDLIWFDLSGFDETETVTSAKLSLYWYYPSSTRTNDTIVDIYRPAAGWDKNYVCWTYKSSGVSWTNAGGDWYDANATAQGTTPFASITFDNAQVATNQYYEFDVTALVNYYKSTGTNAGFLIKARTENDNYIGFYSLNNASYKPKLEITTTIQQQ